MSHIFEASHSMILCPVHLADLEPGRKWGNREGNLFAASLHRDRTPSTLNDGNAFLTLGVPGNANDRMFQSPPALISAAD